MFKNNKKTTLELFSEKYTKTNIISDKLISNFFDKLNYLYNEISDKVVKIHEIGCGPGVSTQKIKKFLKSQDFTASDFELELVTNAQKLNPDVQIKNEDIYNLANINYDLVFLLEVAEHLHDYEKALIEVSKRTKYLIVSVPNEPLWRLMNMVRLKYIKDLGNTPGHINHWSPKGFKKVLSKNYEILSSSYPIPWQIHLCKVK